MAKSSRVAFARSDLRAPSGCGRVRQHKSSANKLRLPMANATLDELHRSMGEFLTACAHLENMLWGLLIICDSDTTTFQDIAKQFLPLTFGARVDLLVKKCSAKQFSPDDRFARWARYATQNFLDYSCVSARSRRQLARNQK